MLSIILPVRNSEALIEKCLESIATQDGCEGRFELLISDNCSSDGTLEVIERFLRQNENLRLRTRVFPQGENLGVFGNLNFLLGNCAYDHVHIMCADDYYSNEQSMKTLLNTVEQRPTVPLFAFDNNWHHAEDSHWKLIEKYAGTGTLRSEDVVKFLFCFGCFLGGLSNICLNRKYFPEANYFKAEYFFYGDIEFYARTAIEGGSLYLAREEITFRLHHEKSISSTENRENTQSIESIYTLTMLYEELRRMGIPAFPLRCYGSYHVSQFYHRAFKTMVVNRTFRSLRNIMAAQRQMPACLPPVWTLLMAILVRPKIYRGRLHTVLQRTIVKYLFRYPEASGSRSH